MLKKIKLWIEKKKQLQAQKQQLIKMQKYYHLLRSGATFIKYIQDDFKKAETNKMNRHQRRRFEREISKEGKFSPEIIEHYKNQIDKVLSDIEKLLNPCQAKQCKCNSKLSKTGECK